MGVVMSVIVTLAFAAAASSDVMGDWAKCATAYGKPRLTQQTAEQLTDNALAACGKEEEAALQEYIRDFGAEQGKAVFVGIRVNVRRILIRHFSVAKGQ